MQSFASTHVSRSICARLVKAFGLPAHLPAEVGYNPRRIFSQLGAMDIPAEIRPPFQYDTVEPYPTWVAHTFQCVMRPPKEFIDKLDILRGQVIFLPHERTPDGSADFFLTLLDPEEDAGALRDWMHCITRIMLRPTPKGVNSMAHSRLATCCAIPGIKGGVICAVSLKALSAL
jgi:hypothetical protein